MNSEMLDVTARLHHANGGLNFSLEVFGNQLAEREGYRENKGLEAIRFYLMGKHGWLPMHVNSMSLDDLRFAMSEEMSGWTLPAEARRSYPMS